TRRKYSFPQHGQGHAGVAGMHRSEALVATQVAKRLSVEPSSPAAALHRERRIQTAMHFRANCRLADNNNRLPSSNHPIRSRQHIRRNGKADLFGSREVVITTGSLDSLAPARGLGLSDRSA